MPPSHETEIKLEVRNPRALKRRLTELGFCAIEPRHFESNWVLDFQDQRLRKAGWLLRLRFANGRGVLTFKGAPLPARGYKIRREIEAEVEDGRQLQEILRRVGMREFFRYEKYRTVFAERLRRKSAEAPALFYDETPIGNYVELEGPTRWIDRVAGRLGYERGDYIPASYRTLYVQKCLERGKSPGNMVFRRRKS
jgi:adenylate cyclase, class 2